MKFCKNLQRVVDLADPEWAPYWTNYKMLKKLIKELPSLVPAEEQGVTGSASRNNAATRPRSITTDSDDCSSTGGGPRSSSSTVKQNHGDDTSEAAKSDDAVRQQASSSTASAEAATETADNKNSSSVVNEEGSNNNNGSGTGGGGGGAINQISDYHAIGKSPGEIAFFKLLHAEFKKATHFFERAQQEYVIREDRVQKGMEIMKQATSIMVNEKWSLLAKSIYRLYKDLLLLETFAIMTYCGFSKILKKHDKVTGYHTRSAFMANIVDKANFTNYPKVLEMISRCEQLYEEVSERLIQDGENNLYEDERLFINMIHRLNEQVIDSVGAETGDGMINSNNKETPGGSRSRSPTVPSTSINAVASLHQKTTWATSSLKSLVEENEARKIAAKIEVSEGHAGEDADDTDDDNAKKGSDTKSPAHEEEEKEQQQQDDEEEVADTNNNEDRKRKASIINPEETTTGAAATTPTTPTIKRQKRPQQVL